MGLRAILVRSAIATSVKRLTPLNLPQVSKETEEIANTAISGLHSFG